MVQLTATGAITIVGEGFTAYGDSDTSEGRGARILLASFSTLEEALQCARGKGVQGDSGYVSSFRTLLYKGGVVATHATPLTDRRRTPEGDYKVGFLDLREYEYGYRLASAGPVRPYDSSFFASSPFSVPLKDTNSIVRVEAEELRKMLANANSVLVGAWRRVGDDQWRGEFTITSAGDLDKWLPSRR